MNNNLQDNYIIPGNDILCHKGALYTSFSISFDFKLDSCGLILINKKNEDENFQLLETESPTASNITEEILKIADEHSGLKMFVESGEGIVNFPVKIGKLSEDAKLSISVFFNKNYSKNKFEIQINKCNLNLAEDVGIKYKRVDFSKNSFSSNSTQTTPTPSSTEDFFIYNPEETPTPTPLDANFSTGMANNFGDWFYFDEVTAQIPYDLADNSSVPIIFKNASFDFSNFPSLDLIDPTSDRVDLLLYIQLDTHK